MHPLLTPKTVLSLIVAATLAACSTSDTGHVPAAYFDGTTLDRYELQAQQRTEHLKVYLDPRDSQMRRTEVRKVEAFLRAYRERGHGPLHMSIPEGATNQKLVIAAAAEIRDLSWVSGLEYEQIKGSAYDARGVGSAPILMAFTQYDVQVPTCPSAAQVDFADARSNNDMPSLGCSVRTNLAAMIADPADLLGSRALDPADAGRRHIQFDKWRQGETPAATRSEDSSGAVSSVID
jgi:pilus assembly protein CpaD